MGRQREIKSNIYIKIFYYFLKIFTYAYTLFMLVLMFADCFKLSEIISNGFIIFLLFQICNCIKPESKSKKG